MINLVPTAGLTAIKKEYWVRVGSVWVLLLGTICVMGTIFLLPSYINLSIQINDAKSVMNSLNETATSFDISAAQLTVANQQAALLVRDAETTPWTEYIAQAESVRQPGVSISSFVLRTQPDEPISFTLSGQADSRQSLVDFRDALEASDTFLHVTLPISNFITNQDIPFALEITIATSTPDNI